VILLLPAVQTDGPHVVGLAEPLGLALCELGASQPPADQEVLASVFMIGFVPPSTLASISSPAPRGGAVVVSVVVATSLLLLSTSSQLAPVVPVWSLLGLADQDQDQGEQEEGEEEFHGDLRSGLRLYESTRVV